MSPPSNEFDSLLATRTTPADWTNPQPNGRYNLVVIGGGPAGLVAAASAAGLGAKVALIEQHRLGGDCLNYGCVPSKAILKSARVAATVRRAAEFGIVTGESQVDFATVMNRMRRLRAEMSQHDSAERFRSLGVDVYLGRAEFVGSNRVRVDGKTLEFRKALIATGARASVPNLPGLSNVPYLTNETVFELNELPRRLVILGGGPIGCELAQAFARFGSQVTLLHRGERLLKRDDPDAAEIVRQTLLRDSVRVELNAMARLVGTNRIEWQGAAVEFDSLLVATGRQPNVSGLGLEAANVDFDEVAGVRVDDFLRTTNRNIFAAGDCCSAERFTHAADFQARLVVRNALFFGRQRASRLLIPRCTFTDPEVAHVGLTIDDAARAGVRVDTWVQPFAQVDRALLDGETEGFVKVLTRAGSDRIVGATIVASHAGDLISEIGVAIAGGVGLRKLAGVIHPYPTQADAMRKLGDAVQRSRLTPTIRSLFERWLAWRR